VRLILHRQKLYSEWRVSESTRRTIHGVLSRIGKEWWSPVSTTEIAEKPAGIPQQVIDGTE